jgi:hypothetical protein
MSLLLCSASALDRRTYFFGVHEPIWLPLARQWAPDRQVGDSLLTQHEALCPGCGYGYQDAPCSLGVRGSGIVLREAYLLQQVRWCARDFVISHHCHPCSVVCQPLHLGCVVQYVHRSMV